MSLYPEYDYDLIVLEITGQQEIPTLTAVHKQYLKLSLLRHPDKHPDNQRDNFTEMFQELLTSYTRLSEQIAKNIDVGRVDKLDQEEKDLYDFFTKNNFVRENKGSVTVCIENGLEKQWSKALINAYGVPEINKDGGGKMDCG